MRTTVTLDEELERKLRDRMRRTGEGFKETLRCVLLRGFGAEAKTGKFKVLPRRMGMKSGLDPARLQDIETDLEVERFLEVSRRLTKR